MSKLEIIRLKYYSDLGRDQFHSLIEIDPTTISHKKMGKYSKWILLHTDFFIGADIELWKEIFSQFDKNKVQFPEKKKDIGQWLPEDLELWNLTGGNLFLAGKKEENLLDYVEVHKCDKWSLVVPLSFDASRRYGRSTKWCTTQRQYYDNYTNVGPLLIIIHRKTDKKWQFSFAKFEYRDSVNAGIRIEEFLFKNPEIFIPIARVREKSFVDMYFQKKKKVEQQKESVVSLFKSTQKKQKQKFEKKFINYQTSASVNDMISKLV